MLHCNIPVRDNNSPDDPSDATGVVEALAQ